MTVHATPPGGGFLLDETAVPFIPEDFSLEQRQIAETTEAFIRNEILPDLDRLEEQDFALLRAKLRRCADLGLFLVDIPERYGGLELDKATSMLVAETIGPSGSFAITSSGQTGIGSLPLVYYGTAEQKERYLAKLTSGEWIAAYCLTEPDCGSDPLSARTTATLSEDGSCYLLNGVKQFITNAAFADLFTVFAKIDGRQFSAFLVERDSPGLSVGAEERKMGLKGTSTAQVILDNVRVPRQNLLGEAGQGHKIAFNVLNIGRLKLAATVVGAAKGALAEAATYAGERKQFGRLLREFGAIREKLADMSAALFAAESVLYRVAGLLDARIATLDRDTDDYPRRYRQAIEEYAGECAIAKVFCSEALGRIADEALQIHGGYGYIRDYPVERYYRDQRINRIFEGTNEINRLLIPNLLLRRADEKRLELWERVRTVEDDLTTGKLEECGQDLLAKTKTLYLLLLGAVRQRHREQEILLALGDMAIDIFALESVLLRTDKARTRVSPARRQLLQAAARTASFELAARIGTAAARCAAYAAVEADPAGMQPIVSRLSACPTTGLLESKRLLAAATSDTGGYPF
ncbi:alkylation response protein AidB-like acyl-CoA dehydrogenase [Geothermobacter ehrlichii]|uniref:Alkylation response protein AidB-like acyl-CoA dehydrogenase n=1 Tax=Geothermobacter ehrlichii TaxID=213224 RepID=A0A5D3WPP1_9BACT|nr:acyl-CoA dehydrogenase family protein [Geothermobacter ehrlichii]TYO99378.1 alkylation response protein AidB-like acyl-CoA dehydrogenase [Geothermobacter ehrlichii]